MTDRQQDSSGLLAEDQRPELEPFRVQVAQLRIQSSHVDRDRAAFPTDAGAPAPDLARVLVGHVYGITVHGSREGTRCYLDRAWR